MLMTLLNKFGDCSEHSWFDTVPTPPPPPTQRVGRKEDAVPLCFRHRGAGLALTVLSSSEELKATRRA